MSRPLISWRFSDGLFSFLSAADRAFASRVATQAILFSSEGSRMDKLARGLMRRLNLPPPTMTPHASVNTTASTRLKGAAHLGESCPACHTDVVMDDIMVASCANGHIWGMGFCFRNSLTRLATTETCAHRVQLSSLLDHIDHSRDSHITDLRHLLSEGAVARINRSTGRLSTVSVDFADIAGSGAILSVLR